jgi:putative ABC transport system ATP-binding protein
MYNITLAVRLEASYDGGHVKNRAKTYPFERIYPMIYRSQIQSMSLIQAENLTKKFGKGETLVVALDHVSLSVVEGEFLAVMGPSGCGKSTLLYLLGGLDSPTEGRVVINGQVLNDLSDEELTKLRRQEIGFVFQFYNLIPVLDATENAALPITLNGTSRGKARAKASEWLVKVGLGDRLNSRPDQLSGGQQQRVAVARALVAEPKLILADEPTGNLDTRSSEEIAELLRQVANEWGRSVVMVTHDPYIASFADRILFLKDGVIVGETRPEPANSNNAELVADIMRQIA